MFPGMEREAYEVSGQEILQRGKYITGIVVTGPKRLLTMTAENSVVDLERFEPTKPLQGT